MKWLTGLALTALLYSAGCATSPKHSELEFVQQESTRILVGLNSLESTLAEANISVLYVPDIHLKNKKFEKINLAKLERIIQEFNPDRVLIEGYMGEITEDTVKKHKGLKRKMRNPDNWSIGNFYLNLNTAYPEFFLGHTQAQVEGLETTSYLQLKAEELSLYFRLKSPSSNGEWQLYNFLLDNKLYKPPKDAQEFFNRQIGERSQQAAQMINPDEKTLVILGENHYRSFADSLNGISYGKVPLEKRWRLFADRATVDIDNKIKSYNQRFLRK